MKRMAFHAGSHATGKVFKLLLILMLHATANRHHVANSSILRILRGQDVIEQCAFVKIGVTNLRINREKRARHFDHVVDVAGFRGASVDVIVQLVRRAKILILAVSPGGEAVMQRDVIPEVHGGFVVDLVSRVDVPR